MSIKLNNRVANIISLFLPLYPILDCYSFISFLSLGKTILLTFLVIASVSCNNVSYHFPEDKCYYRLWIYLAISYFLSCIGSLSFGAFIPGSLSFVIFSVMLIFTIPYVDFKIFYKSYRGVVFIAGILLLVQEVSYFTMGIRPFFVLPLGEINYGTMTYSELMWIHTTTDRSSSIFLEPAHMAQYVLPFLCVELFYKENKNKLFSPFSIFVIIILALLKSGNGMVGLAIVLLFKALIYSHNQRKAKVFLIAILLVPLTLFFFNRYISTEGGQKVLERTEELTMDSDAHSYSRIGLGYEIYGSLPLFNQVIGMSDDNLISSGFVKIRNKDVGSSLYCNGLSKVLISAGALGLLFWLMFLVPIFKGASYIGKSVLVLLLVLSLFSAMYLTAIMWMVLIIAILDNNNINV